MNSIEITLGIFSLEITMMSKTSINYSILFALPVDQVWLKTVGFHGSQNFYLPNVSVIYPYISWHKYHQTPILLW